MSDKKIAVITREFQLGDTIRCLGMAQALKQMDYTVVWIQHDIGAYAIRHNPYIDVLIKDWLPSINDKKINQFLKDEFGFVDVGIIAYPSHSQHGFNILDGVAFDIYHKMPNYQFSNKMNIVDINLEMLHQIGYKGMMPRPHFVTDNYFGKYKKPIVIYPFYKSPTWVGKDFGISNWLTLITNLESPNHDIIVIGSQGDLESPEYLVLNKQGNIIDLVGDLSINQTAKLLKESHASISTDSGIAHLASIMDCPRNIVLFRATSPRINAPYWSNPICIELNRGCDLQLGCHGSTTSEYSPANCECRGFVGTNKLPEIVEKVELLV